MKGNTDPLITIFGKVELATLERKLKGIKLKQTEKNYLSRSIRPKLRAAHLAVELNLLSKISQRREENTALIEDSLSLYGYPLMGTGKKAGKYLSPEELIGMIIAKAPSARFIEAIPIVIIKNTIDPFKLLEVAVKYGIKNQVGYLLETALLLNQGLKPKQSSNLQAMPYLKLLLEYLKRGKGRHKQQLVEGDREFLIQTSPPRIKRWNLLGRFFDEDFKALAEAYL